MIKNILLPLDKSAPSRAALSAAVELAEAMRASITMISVVQPLTTWVSGPFGAIAQMIEEDTREEHRAHEQLLKVAAKEIPDAVAFRTIVCDGDPADEIVRQLDSGDYDLVVLGARRLSALKSAVLGGVSRRVLAATDVPVLVVRADDDAQPLSIDQLENASAQSSRSQDVQEATK